MYEAHPNSTEAKERKTTHFLCSTGWQTLMTPLEHLFGFCFTFLNGREYLYVPLLLFTYCSTTYSLWYNEVYAHNSHSIECLEVLFASGSSSTNTTTVNGAFLFYICKPIIKHSNTSNTAIILLQICSPQNAKQQIELKPEVPASV